MPLAIEAEDIEVGKQYKPSNSVVLKTAKKVNPTELPQEQLDIIHSKGDQGYLIRFIHSGGGSRRALIIGAEWRGLLHASNTFRLLMKREGQTIYAKEGRITDWPDFKIRGLPVWPLPSSYEDFRKYIDWAFQYKFNRIYTYTTRKYAADGFNLPTAEERIYLKRINRYAKDRGIIINYALSWAVGAAVQGQNGENSGAVPYNGHYYTWSDDVSLRKRAIEIAKFARDTDAGSLHLHCMDTYEGGWDKRGNKDSERFGNDRAEADANVINIFTAEIRRLNPDIELQFVVYPYNINFNLKGNESYKMWMRRLSALIPKDVYLAVTDFNRDLTDSWIGIVNQPLVHWINGNAFQWGRYFSTYPAFSKSSYYPGRDRDILVNFEPIGHFNGEVMQLFASEYAWNTEAPGSSYVLENIEDKVRITGGNQRYRNVMIDTMDANTWAWYRGTMVSADTTRRILLRACKSKFGEAAGPYMVEFFAFNPVGWRTATLYSQVLTDVKPGNELHASLDQLNKAEQALAKLKEAADAAMLDRPARERLNIFMTNTYRQRLVLIGTTTYYQANEYIAAGRQKDAEDVIKIGTRKLSETRQEMELKGYWSDDSHKWFEQGNLRLFLAENNSKNFRASNLIGNPGFEEPLRIDGQPLKRVPKWLATSGSLELSKKGRSGRYAGKLTLKPTDRYVILEQPIHHAVRCKYYIGFWMKKAAGFRVVPIIQYWDTVTGRKTESTATVDLPPAAEVPRFTLYSGVVSPPPQAKQVVFQIYADWFGAVPTEEKHLYIDDITVSCLPTI